MGQNENSHLGMTICGAILAFIGLFFPLLTVTYAPPGGSAIVYGQRMSAFVDTISGWQFASTAAYFKLLPSIIILFATVGISIIYKIFSRDRAKSVVDSLGSISKLIKIASDSLRALVHILITVGWLALLFLEVIVASLDSPQVTVEMPRNGEAGILPSFQADPFSAAQQTALPTTPTPHLSASLGLGFYLLAFGLIIGGLAIFKKVVIVAVATGVILLILFYVDRPWCLDIINYLGF